MFLFKFCRFEFRKNVFVDVSCIIKCDKPFLLSELRKIKQEITLLVNYTLFYTHSITEFFFLTLLTSTKKNIKNFSNRTNVTQNMKSFVTYCTMLYFKAVTHRLLLITLYLHYFSKLLKLVNVNACLFLRFGDLWYAFFLSFSPRPLPSRSLNLIKLIVIIEGKELNRKLFLTLRIDHRILYNNPNLL